MALTCTGGLVPLAQVFSSERRWTLRLPPSPRFGALVWWVDGALLPIPPAPAYPGAHPPCGAQRPHIAPPAFARGRGYRPQQPADSHRTTKHQSRSGATTTGPGGYHNRRPTGGVLLYAKLIRCNDYQTQRPLRTHPGKPTPKKGFLGAKPLS